MMTWRTPQMHVVVVVAYLVVVLLQLAVPTRAANLTITVTFDDLPEETSWSFMDVETNTDLFRQDDNHTYVNQTMTFSKLTTGNYTFWMKDSGMDGICCSNGTGMITFSNETDNKVLYQHNGNFTETLQINVQVDEDGYISSIAEKVVPTSVQHNDDPEWPGIMGTALNHSFTVNVRFLQDSLQNNNNNSTLTIEIWKKDDTYFNTGWIHPPFLWYQSSTGSNQDSATLWSETYDNVEAGLYFMRISSSSSYSPTTTTQQGGGDDTNSIGWATITNHTDVVWQVSEDDFSRQQNMAEVFMIVKGYYGYTFETKWNGNGDDPP